MDRERLELTKVEGLLSKSDTSSTSLIDEAWKLASNHKEALAVSGAVVGVALLSPLLKRGLGALAGNVEERTGSNLLSKPLSELESRSAAAGTENLFAAQKATQHLNSATLGVGESSSVSLATRVGADDIVPDYRLRSIVRARQSLKVGAAPETVTPGESMVQWVKVDGEYRDYMMHIPRSFDPKKSTPLVVAMEGFLVGSPNPYRSMAEAYGMNEQAEKLGFIAMYPVPKPRHGGRVFTWNEPDGATNFLGVRDYSDNNYIRAAMNQVMDRFNIDSKQVYGVGFSQGALQLHSLIARNEPGTFRAMASIAGTTTDKVGLPPAGTRLLVIHSKADPTLPYSGGTGFVPSFVDNMGWGFAKDSKPYAQVENYLRANSVSVAPSYKHFSEFRVKSWTNPGDMDPVVQEVLLSSKYGHTFPGRATREAETLFSVVNGAIPPPQVLDAKRWITEDFFAMKSASKKAM